MANKKPYYEILFENFNKLSDRTKQLFFQIISFPFEQNGTNFELFVDSTDLDYSYCESPIEELLALAWDFVYCILRRNGKMCIELLAQEEVTASGNRYRPDFIFHNADCKDRGINDFLVVECDGHDFHEKTKEQVRKGLKRDYDLKLEGYDILHFSGSQIYNNPIKCAIEIWNYLEKKWGDSIGNQESC